MAAPMPLAPPVTSATRPEKRSSFIWATAASLTLRVRFDPATDYPLGSRRPDLVRTPSGLPLDEVTLEAARDGHARRGGHARDGRDAGAPGRGRPSGGPARSSRTDLDRAAELTGVPDDELLAIYTALRPGPLVGRRARDLGRAPRGARRRADRRVRARGAGGLRGARAPRRWLTPRSAPLRVPRGVGAAARDARRALPGARARGRGGPDDPEPELVVEDGVVRGSTAATPRTST